MITKVKWKNYKALGNLELDFTNATGEPYNTIVLAGGKWHRKNNSIGKYKQFFEFRDHRSI